MIKSITLAGAIAVFAHSAGADTYTTGTVIDIQPEYAQVMSTVPVQNCYNVQSGGSTGDVLAGAIVGGAIGNQFGGGSGQDAMTVLGAIVGADIAEQPRLKQQCETYYQNSYTQELVGYTVTYDAHGDVGIVHTNRSYYIGEPIKLRMIVY